IIEVVSRNRGHLASNLGTVELVLALHRCFDFCRDRLVWDCGHQAYAHKILTGRRDEFHTLRQEGGISGFADRRESPYDAFTFGHTATSLSAALGLACADEVLGMRRRVVAVIGDGAMASGMAFEALNHAGELGRDLLVVLNDNKMSISRSVGAIARYLSKVRASAPYADIKHEVQDILTMVPMVGSRFEGLLARLREGIQSALTPGGLFVELGFHYYGPVNGHDIGELIDTFEGLKRINGPALLHVLTEKGHGFHPASENPVRFHSSRRFELANGSLCSVESPEGLSYSKAFGSALCEMAERDPRIVAITAAMPDGTGLSEFADRFPDRFYNVGICEQHAVGLANGLAAGGLRPVLAVYSTFLQRAYDQLFHDVALQEAPVVFCIDRAGLVGSDGPTHHGLNDIAYCRAMHGFVVMAPANVPELRRMLELALAAEAPAAIRYPRESLPEGTAEDPAPDFAVGEAEICRQGQDAAVIAYGAMVRRGLDAARILAREDGLELTVVNARFARPLDLDVIRRVVQHHDAVLLAEDHSVAGGFGSAVLEALAACGVGAAHVQQAAVPVQLVAHASRDAQLARLELDGGGLAARLRRLMDGRP
ncbi:MAG: 1-deoxy-D-xylulose-5-phosphate synthase, partial [Planctomycetota bacterium]